MLSHTACTGCPVFDAVDDAVGDVEGDELALDVDERVTLGVGDSDGDPLTESDVVRDIEAVGDTLAVAEGVCVALAVKDAVDDCEAETLAVPVLDGDGEAAHTTLNAERRTPPYPAVRGTQEDPLSIEVSGTDIARPKPACGV